MKVTVSLPAKLPTKGITELHGVVGGPYGVAPLSDFADGTLCFLLRNDPAEATRCLSAQVSNAALIIRRSCLAQVEGEFTKKFIEKNLIIATDDSPRGLFSRIVETALSRGHNLLKPSNVSPAEDHPSVAKTANVAPSARLGSRTLVGDGALIGEGVVIGPDCVIGERAIIFDGVQMGASVNIGSGSIIGNRVNAFEPSEGGTGWNDIVQVGGLVIGSDVRIGALAVINAGTLTDTVIGNHIRIGDRAVIAHNCHVADGAVVLTAATVAGSVKIGAKAWISPGCAINSKIKIGDAAFIGIGCVVTDDVPAGARLLPTFSMSSEDALGLRRLLQEQRKM